LRKSGISDAKIRDSRRKSGIFKSEAVNFLASENEQIFFINFFFQDGKVLKNLLLREELKSENSGIFSFHSGSSGLDLDSGINPGQIRDMDSLNKNKG